MASRIIKMQYRFNKNADISYEQEIERELRAEMIKKLTPPDYADCFPEFAFAYSEGQHWLETASMSDILYLREEYITHYSKFAQCADKTAYLKQSPVFTDPVIANLMRSYLQLEGDIPITVRNMESEFGFVEAAKSGFYAYEAGFVDLINMKDPRCIFTEEQAD